MTTKKQRCAIYTRKSSEEGLEQAFNSLHAQREACEAYINSQKHEGWQLLTNEYDDGGVSGGTLDRPSLTRLIADIKQGTIDVVVVYKVDRLSRSLSDFTRLIELFDQHEVSFVSVTQQFNTSTSMGRLTLNVLLSFAQFEREVTGERIRDKIAASKQKGMWMGGTVPLGYDVIDKQLVVNTGEAEKVRRIYHLYLTHGCVKTVKAILDQKGETGKSGKPFSRGALYTLLKNPIYAGQVNHKGKHYPGQHTGLISTDTWQQVQQQLTGNTLNHRTSKTQDPSMLAGLLFDDKGNPMSPSHTRKQNKRYRYYVSQAVLQFKDSHAGSVIRVPAKEIEQPVLSAIQSLFSDPQQLTQAMGEHKTTAHQMKALIQQAQIFAETLPILSPHEHIAFLKRIIDRIVVSHSTIDIRLLTQGIAYLLTDDEMESKPDPSMMYTLRLPVQLKRCGIETKLIISNQPEQPAHTRSIQAIQKALIKALEWHQQLTSDKPTTIRKLAQREKVTPRYIGRRIKLAYLAPDIMQAIIKGNIPVNLSLTTLIDDIPLEWQRQREMLGFRMTSNEAIQ